MAREPGWGKGRRIGASVRHRDKIPDFKRRKRNPLRDHVNRCAEIPRDRHGFIRSHGVRGQSLDPEFVLCGVEGFKPHSGARGRDPLRHRREPRADKAIQAACDH